MIKTENEFWSDNRPYYILYEDRTFMKNLYAQLFIDFPDVGEIAYIGTSSHKISKDYSIGSELNVGDDRKKSDKKLDVEKNNKKDQRQRAGINICDIQEESQIREYANIKEIKEMNNMLFYKKILRKLTHVCSTKECKNLYHIKGKILMYDSYKEDEDVFVKMEGSCVWLKKSNMDITAMNMTGILGNVHMIGYIIEEETKTSPMVIKAIAIYT